MTTPDTNYKSVTATTEKVGNKYVTEMTVKGLTFTSADQEDKTITVEIKDNNGNIGRTSAVTYLDRDVATITVSDSQGTRISKSHTARRIGTYGPTEASRVIEGVTTDIAFNDYSFFSFTWDKPICEYKVCVNTGLDNTMDEEAYQAAVEELPYIGKNYNGVSGCKNMYWSAAGGEEKAAGTTNCLIEGATFAAEEAVNEVNGTYEVIVYAKSQALLWSAGHPFTIPVKTKSEATAEDAGGNPVTVDIINGDVDNEAKSTAPSGSVTMQFETNSDVRNVATYELTADVSELDLEASDTVDVYHYE